MTNSAKRIRYKNKTIRFKCVKCSTTYDNNSWGCPKCGSHQKVKH